MNVHDLKISLRPRHRWEPVDLGFHLTREYYGDLFKIGLWGFLPLWVLIAFLCCSVPGLAFFLIWWLKPIYDRFYLYYFSRRIFGSEVSVGSVLKQWPRFLFVRSFGLLTWRRLSPARSMMLAVRDLEKLKGQSYGKRCTVLKRMGGEVASTTTVTLHVCEEILVIGLALLIYLFIPQMSGMSFENIELFMTSLAENKAFTILTSLLPAIVVLFIEPFYVGAGFCLYLNSRSSQEAWDIDLQFKGYAERLKKNMLTVSHSIGAALLLGLFAVGGVTEAKAEERSPQEVLEEVYAHEDFKVRTQKVPQWERSDQMNAFEKWLEELFGSRAGSGSATTFGEGALMVFAIVILVALVVLVLVVVLRSLSDRDPSSDPGPQKVKPSVVMGMEVSRESLPKELLQAAREAWNTGDAKLALSLLYRGAVSDLLLQHDVEIQSSDTELECLRAVRKGTEPSLGEYFHLLTQHWMTVAYSNDRVRDEEFNILQETWPFKK